jgi:hypothetical protein
MESEKVVINTDNLAEADRQAREKGKVIESFHCDEVSLVAGGVFEMGPIYDIKYKDNEK